LKWHEFLRPAYLGVAIVIALFWWSHPLLLEATSKIKWEI
ncbi:MAG: NnrU family protein, partial [Nostoc sp.]